MSLAFDDSGDDQADRFWPAATHTTVALARAAGEARVGPKRQAARERIVVLCDGLRRVAGNGEGALVGRIADSLGSFVARAELDEQALDVIAGHLEALRAVVSHAIAGDGGTIGRAIMAGLEASVARHPPNGHTPAA